MGSDGRQHRGGVRDTGDGTLEITFQYNGRRERARLDLNPNEKSHVKRARDLRTSIIQAISRGTFTFQEYLPGSRGALEEAKALKSTEALTLAKAFEKSLAVLIEDIEPETLSTYHRDARAWMSTLGADTDVAKITVANIKEAVSKLKISVKRIRNFLIPLRHAFVYAVDDRKVETSPLDSYKVKRRKKKPDEEDAEELREIPFTVKEVALLETADPYSGQIWRLWAYTGCRGQELVALKWSNVKPDGLHIRRAIRTGRIKSTKTESGKRIIQISPQAQAALDALKEHTGHQEYVVLNPNTKKHFHGDRPLRHCFIRDSSKVGLPYKEPRLLRHSFASWHLETGESPLWIAQQMGHKTVEEVLRTYARHIPKNIDTHGQKFQAALKAGRDLGHGFD